MLTGSGDMHETKLAQARTELQEYLAFQPGWDGYRGKTFGSCLVAAASALAEQLAAQFGDELTDLIPGPASDGSIDLEFRMRDTALIVTLYDGEAPRYIWIKESLIKRHPDLALRD